MNKIKKLLLVVLIGALYAAIAAFFLALPVMLLWDWICPALFKLPEITFWQAIGLTWLCGLLFKSSTGSSE